MATRVQITLGPDDPHAVALCRSGVLGYKIEEGHDRVAALLDAGVRSDSDVTRTSLREGSDRGVAPTNAAGAKIDWAT